MFGFGILTWIKIGIAAALLGTLAWYVHEYDRRGRAEVTLTLQLTEAKNAIRVAESQVKLTENLVKGLDQRLAERMNELEENCKLLAMVNGATGPEADKPVGGLTGWLFDWWAGGTKDGPDGPKPAVTPGASKSSMWWDYSIFRLIYDWLYPAPMLIEEPKKVEPPAAKPAEKKPTNTAKPAEKKPAAKKKSKDDPEAVTGTGVAPKVQPGSEVIRPAKKRIHKKDE